MTRRIASAALAIATMAASLLWYLDDQHSYEVETHELTFTSNGNQLRAVLALPPGDGPHGVVAFVHGDGPIDATHSDGYLPIFEALARAGYASISWDKPGVGDSTGHWLDQSMSDRADEVRDAIEAIGDRAELDTDDVGVIGFSQAGWVLPLLPERLDDLDFLIYGSPAIAWNEQGRYLTERALDARGADDDLADRVRRADATGDTVLAEGDYADYLDWHRELDADVAAYFGEMDPDRWGFARRNQHVDARDTLAAAAGTPTLLLLAGQDENVDVGQTEATYRELMEIDSLAVAHYPEANHSLLDREGAWLTITAIVRPRSIFADGLLGDVTAFATEQRDEQ